MLWDVCQNTLQPVGFTLRFDSLYPTKFGFAFPCDAFGNVDMDAMPDAMRRSYLYARHARGEFSMPRVQPEFK